MVLHKREYDRAIKRAQAVVDLLVDNNINAVFAYMEKKGSVVAYGPIDLTSGQDITSITLKKREYDRAVKRAELVVDQLTDSNISAVFAFVDKDGNIVAYGSSDLANSLGVNSGEVLLAPDSEDCGKGKYNTQTPEKQGLDAIPPSSVEEPLATSLTFDPVIIEQCFPTLKKPMAKASNKDLRKLIVRQVRYLHGNPKWGVMKHRPPWWPQEIPWLRRGVQLGISMLQLRRLVKAAEEFHKQQGPVAIYETQVKDDMSPVKESAKTSAKVKPVAKKVESLSIKPSEDQMEFPTLNMPIEEASNKDLRKLVVRQVRYLHGCPKWGVEDHRPQWWPEEIPWSKRGVQLGISLTQLKHLMLAAEEFYRHQVALTGCAGPFKHDKGDQDDEQEMHDSFGSPLKSDMETSLTTVWTQVHHSSACAEQKRFPVLKKPMSQASNKDLRKLVVQQVRHLHGNPMWGVRAHQPPWWPREIPWAKKGVWLGISKMQLRELVVAAEEFHKLREASTTPLVSLSPTGSSAAMRKSARLSEKKAMKVEPRDDDYVWTFPGKRRKPEQIPQHQSFNSNGTVDSVTSPVERKSARLFEKRFVKLEPMDEDNMGDRAKNANPKPHVQHSTFPASLNIFSDVKATVSMNTLPGTLGSKRNILQSIAADCELSLSCDEELTNAAFLGNLEQVIKARDMIAKTIPRAGESGNKQNYLSRISYEPKTVMTMTSDNSMRTWRITSNLNDNNVPKLSKESSELDMVDMGTQTGPEIMKTCDVKEKSVQCALQMELECRPPAVGVFGNSGGVVSALHQIKGNVYKVNANKRKVLHQANQASLNHPWKQNKSLERNRISKPYMRIENQIVKGDVPNRIVQEKLQCRDPTAVTAIQGAGSTIIENVKGGKKSSLDEDEPSSELHPPTGIEDMDDVVTCVAVDAAINDESSKPCIELADGSFNVVTCEVANVSDDQSNAQPEFTINALDTAEYVEVDQSCGTIAVEDLAGISGAVVCADVSDSHSTLAKHETVIMDVVNNTSTFIPQDENTGTQVYLEDVTDLDREEVVVDSEGNTVYIHLTTAGCDQVVGSEVRPEHEKSSLDLLALLGEVAEQSQLNEESEQVDTNVAVTTPSESSGDDDQDDVEDEPGPDNEVIIGESEPQKTSIPPRKLRKHKSRLGKVLDEKGQWKIPCSQCSFMARKPYMMKKHMELHRQGKKAFRCRHCSFSALQGNLVAQHELTTHSGLIFACEECSYRTDSLERMKNHSRVKHRVADHLSGATNSPVVFQCPICDFRSTYENHYNRHVEIHRAPEGANVGDSTSGLVSVFKCLHCPYETNKKKLFQRHMNHIHQCVVCGSIFAEQSELITHRETHTEEDRLLCHLCGKYFKIWKELDAHMKFHSGEYKHMCDCGQPFSSEMTLKKHIRAVHESPRTFPCEYCDKTFSSSEYYKYHVEKVHIEKTTLEAAKQGAEVILYKCDHCEYLTHSHKLLLQHTHQQHRELDTVEGGCIYECTICGFKTLHSTGYQRHLSSHKETKVVTILQRPASSFRCGLCNFHTVQEDLYEEHMLKTHKCGICKQIFVSGEELEAHMTTCSPEKCVSTCQTCLQNFCSQEDLVCHIKENPGHSYHNRRGRPRLYANPLPTKKTVTSHKTEDLKPISVLKTEAIILQCHLCRKEFHDNDTLKEHLATHEDDPKFSCEECGALFRLKQSLQKHIYHNHKLANRFFCGICERVFKRKENLNSHLSTQHGAGIKKQMDRSHFPFACEICGKRFRTKTAKQEHLTVHVEVRSVVCSICDATFKSTRSCYLHRLRVHRKNFQCAKCNSKFSIKARLDLHMRNKHPATALLENVQQRY